MVDEKPETLQAQTTSHRLEFDSGHFLHDWVLEDVPNICRLADTTRWNLQISLHIVSTSIIEVNADKFW